MSYKVNLIIVFILLKFTLSSCVNNEKQHLKESKVNSHQLPLDTVRFNFKNLGLYEKIEDFHKNLSLENFKRDSVLIIQNEHDSNQLDSIIYFKDKNLSISYYKSSYDNQLFLFSLNSQDTNCIKSLAEYVKLNIFDFKNLKEKKNVICTINTDVYSFIIYIYYRDDKFTYDFYIYNLFI